MKNRRGKEPELLNNYKVKYLTCSKYFKPWFRIYSVETRGAWQLRPNPQTTQIMYFGPEPLYLVDNWSPNILCSMLWHVSVISTLDEVLLSRSDTRGSNVVGWICLVHLDLVWVVQDLLGILTSFSGYCFCKFPTVPFSLQQDREVLSGLITNIYWSVNFILLTHRL